MWVIKLIVKDSPHFGICLYEQIWDMIYGVLISALIWRCNWHHLSRVQYIFNLIPHGNNVGFRKKYVFEKSARNLQNPTTRGTVVQYYMYIVCVSNIYFVIHHTVRFLNWIVSSLNVLAFNMWLYNMIFSHCTVTYIPVIKTLVYSCRIPHLHNWFNQNIEYRAKEYYNTI